MHSPEPNVLGNSVLLTERLFRTFASDAVRRVQLNKGLTDHECLEIEADISAAIEALSAIQSRCHAIRKARAA